MSKKPTTIVVPPGHVARLIRDRPGRPRTIPADARPRAIRLTDVEYARVRALVRQLRSGANPPVS